MKVIVFGATGVIGKMAVDRILADGHEVTAFARRPERIGETASQVRLVAGNAMDRAEVAAAIQGHDAVVVTLGSGKSLRSQVRSKGTLNVILGMQQHGVRRLVCQSTLGAHESWSNLNFFWKRIMFGGILRKIFKDHELQEHLVRASGLDWTIVRPSAFADGPETGAFREGFAPSERGLTLTIAKADIVSFLSRQLDDFRYKQQAVGISN